MKQGLIAGFFYFLIVGAVGVTFGILREMFLTPSLGRSFAIMLEVPFMLLVAWFGCRLIVRLTKLPEENTPRIVMGAIAFGMLMAMEQSMQFAIRLLIEGSALSAPWTAGDYVGLGAQIAYAIFPLFVTADTVQET